MSTARRVEDLEAIGAARADPDMLWEELERQVDLATRLEGEAGISEADCARI